jgi:hypothetical protein
MSITRFDKAECKRLSPEVVAALQELAAKHGLTVQAEGGVFDALSYTLKLKFGVQSTTDGTPVEQAAWNQDCEQFYLSPADYRTKVEVITSKGVSPYELIGFVLSRSKFCIRARSLETAQVTLFTESVLRKVSRPSLPKWKLEQEGGGR